MNLTGRRNLGLITAVALVFAVVSAVTAQDKATDDPQEASPVPAEKFADETSTSKELCVGVCAEQAVKSLRQTPAKLEEEVQANVLTGEMRESQGAHIGFSAGVFQKTAPSIVLIRTPEGFGTGFLIDAAGWIITNEHVIAPSITDQKTGARSVKVHLGQMAEGFMIPRKKIWTATIYKSSVQKDLALLKLDELPELELPTVELAARPSTPGNACVTIGHPTAGLLWTLRTGEVAGVGRWPQDSLQNIIAGFSLTGDELTQFQRTLASVPSRKTMISTVGINPGDSGGPLFNTKGEVIAVNFALPFIDVEQRVNLDKFSYHVHLDELREFISDKPERPPVHVPDVFPTADRSHMFDKDEDGRYESWVFEYKTLPRPAGVLVDLDDNTPGSFATDFSAGRAHQSQFEFEYAFQNIPMARTFYDRDNDGSIDWIMTDANNDEVCDFAIERVKSESGDLVWRKAEIESDQQMRDYDLFKDERLGQRLKKLYEATVPGKKLSLGN